MNGAATPLVSIVIPVYNGARYVGLAIESALAQDYPNVEIVVVNDGSTDEGRTREAVAPYLARVRYFEKPNGGVASALNFGIRQMRGEYLSWLSHDDLYRPDKVRRQIERMRELGSDAILYSDFEVVDENGRKQSHVRVPAGDPENFRFVLTIQNFLHGCSLLIPRRCLEAVGGFDERLRTTQDYDLWFRLAERYAFRHMAEPLILSRHHAEQGTLRMRDTALRECNELLTLFVDRLTDDELRRGSRRSVMGGYVDLARSFRQRGFNAALHASVQKALRSARSESPFTALAEGLRLASILLLPMGLLSAMMRRLR
jgi:glycosyltransferase involved in cell wall biosynthesis